MNSTFLNETITSKCISIIERHSNDRAKQWFNANNPNFCERPKSILNKNGFDSHDDPQKYFYSINNTINYTSQRFLTYHIKLYGLVNFESLRVNNTGIETFIEFKMENLKAHIIWNYLVDEFPLSKANKMDFQIQAITLKGKISSITNDLSFSDESHLLVLNQTDSVERENLEESLKTTIVESIQQSIKKAFEDKQKD